MMIKCHRCKGNGYCQCCDANDTRCVPASVDGLCCSCAEGRCYKGPDCAKETQQQMNVYRERAHLVAVLASMYPSGWNEDPAEPGWKVMTVQTPRGQMSWHISPEDLDVFEGLPLITPKPWDGHTTEEKYARVLQLARDPWHRGD